MKIVHLCLGCFYFDNSTYQENLLSKYHRQLGYDVEVIAPSVDQVEGKFVVKNEYQKYTTPYGVKVTKLQYKGPRLLAKKLCILKGVKHELESAKPDIIFIHGLQSLSSYDAISYLKHNSNTIVYVDNHVDFHNSAKNFISRELLHKRLWRSIAKKLTPFVRKFYGVLPARVDFLVNVYGIPREKADLLVLGVDDELLGEVQKTDARNRIRKKHSIDDNVTLLVTGGKINSDRPETIQLMKAIARINREDIKLLVFGNPSEELKQEFDNLCNSSTIIYVGWASTKEIYEYFSAADLIAFPGLHSVLWEQAIGFGKPCIFKKMDGFTHVDLGGNCAFFEDYSSEGMADQIMKIVDAGQVASMRDKALEKGKSYFSYREIAARSIQ